MKNKCVPFSLFGTIIAMAIVAGLSACSTQPGAILNTGKLTDDTSFLIGVRQRAILNNPVGVGSRPGLINPERVVCAEPSPDVALAVAQSFGVGTSFFGGGGQGALSASGATAEGVAALGERTQVIQLLRDQMYRACEAYANGAITGTTYTLIMSKNNDAMVTLMIAGVAAGEFGRAGAAIGGSASSESSASVSSLLETTQAADKAADDLKKAEDTEAAKEEKLETKEAAAADTAGKSEAEVEADKAEVDEAEEDVAAAKEDVKEKREIKNAADSKARAEITKVVGAGSIAAKPGVGVGQVLQGMQDNFLREDFADEYVSACIVELGLANAGGPEFVRELARPVAAIRSKMFGKFLRDDPAEHSVRAAAYVKFLQDVGTTERYSLLARHCERRLFEFVVFAHTGDIAVEQEKIRLDAQRIAQQGDATRKETMELFTKLIERCDKLDDPALKKKCVQSATTIAERPGGIFELGEITTIEVPTNKQPLPVVAFDAAKAEQPDFDKQVIELGKATLPAIDPAKLSEDDAKRLSKSLARLTAKNSELKEKVAALKTAADVQLDPTKRAEQDARQNERPGLLTDIELKASAGDDDNTVLAVKKLELEDEISQKAIKDYRELGKNLDGTTRTIEAHLEAITALQLEIKAAVEKKAASDASS